MGKNSRRRQEAKTAAEAPTGGSRADARREQREGSGSGRRSFDRYRAVLVGAIVVVGVGLVGYMVFASAAASAYTCGSRLQAPPSQGSVGTSGELGFPTADEGALHTDGSVEYKTCPPTSGEHRGGGALKRDFYGPSKVQVPNDWIHNLEHGYAVIAYKGEPDSGTLAQIREAMDAAEPSEVALSCGLPNKVVALRFDDMDQPYAVLAWRRALVLDSFDPELITAAATQFQDRPEAPERAC